MKKKHILLGLMALCLAGGVGTTLAAVGFDAGTASAVQTFDKVIELNWGSGSSTASVDDIEDLRVGTPQYRSISVTPKSSKSVAGTVTLTFQIVTGDVVATKTREATGLSVNVYKTDSLVAADAADSVFEAAIDGKSAAPSLTGSTTTVSGTTTLSIVAAENTHETAAYYVLKVEKSGVPLTNAANVFGADITIAQSFAPAA